MTSSLLAIMLLVSAPFTMFPLQSVAAQGASIVLPVSTAGSNTIITIVQGSAAGQVAQPYQPSIAQVNTGSQVTWVNQDSTMHTATADDGSFDTGVIAAGAQGAALVQGQGSIAYHCDIHPFMTGILEVMTQSNVPSEPVPEQQQIPPPAAGKIVDIATGTVEILPGNLNWYEFFVTSGTLALAGTFEALDGVDNIAVQVFDSSSCAITDSTDASFDITSCTTQDALLFEDIGQSGQISIEVGPGTYYLVLSSDSVDDTSLVNVDLGLYDPAATSQGSDDVGIINNAPSTTAGIVNYSAWDVTIQGESQDQSFVRQGVLIITETPIVTVGTTNEANPFDVFLVSGNPGATPESGAIWFMTNNAFVGSDAQLDMAFVSFDSATQTVIVSPDPSTSAIGINGFNAYSGLLADIYQIFNGSMQIQSQDNFQTISGTIDILGTGAIFHSDTPYTAQLSGTYRGDGQLDVSPDSPPVGVPQDDGSFTIPDPCIPALIDIETYYECRSQNPR